MENNTVIDGRDMHEGYTRLCELLPQWIRHTGILGARMAFYPFDAQGKDTVYLIDAEHTMLCTATTVSTLIDWFQQELTIPADKNTWYTVTCDDDLRLYVCPKYQPGKRYRDYCELENAWAEFKEKDNLECPCRIVAPEEDSYFVAPIYLLPLILGPDYLKSFTQLTILANNEQTLHDQAAQRTQEATHGNE